MRERFLERESVRRFLEREREKGFEEEGNADAKKLLLPLSQQVLKIQFFQFFVL